MTSISPARFFRLLLVLSLLAAAAAVHAEEKTEKPQLLAHHWIAEAGKPLSATAGAKIFDQGGNAVDAACAMLGASATIHDAMSWGGETQALIFNPKTGNVVAINALGAAPTGATPEFFRKKRMPYPPDYGPLAAVTPGTPGGLMTMLAEFGTMSLEQILAPSLELAEGFPMDRSTAQWMNMASQQFKQWPYSEKLFITHPGEEREVPYPGEVFRQRDLLKTLRKLIETERKAVAEGKSRKEAIYAAYNRFYKGDIAEAFVKGSQEIGGLHTMEDLANWQVYIEEPVVTNYKGIDVYKLNTWVQGPVLLQMLNMVEQIDIKALGYNSPDYIHTLYQVMNLAFADRDFYYGDPYFPPAEPIKGLLSKKYAKDRLKELNHNHNDPYVVPGDPYPYQGEENPFLPILDRQRDRRERMMQRAALEDDETFIRGFLAGTTSIQSADEEGWVVSITPSGGWVPAAIAGDTGIGMSQRMQSFVLDKNRNPYNVLEPGKRPRATLTPSLALKDGKPFLSFAVQGGDTQEQNLLQFFLNIVEFGMNAQEAAEAPNFNSYQMQSSFGAHDSRPGKLVLSHSMEPYAIRQLRDMGYHVDLDSRTAGPINAIYFDQEQHVFWGASNNHGDDYGVAW
jgi:gamma-glutamyltranspeptidase/glutathione hydrolase